MRVRGFAVVNVTRKVNSKTLNDPMYNSGAATIPPGIHMNNIFKKFGDAYKEMERLWNDTKNFLRIYATSRERQEGTPYEEPYVSFENGNTVRGLRYYSPSQDTEVVDMWIIKNISVDVEE